VVPRQLEVLLSRAALEEAIAPLDSPQDESDSLLHVHGVEIGSTPPPELEVVD
jgi:hypothetical protein